MQGNFYVRVKRNRDEHPLEQLCIIEDSSIAPDKHKKRRSVDSLSTQLSGLHTSSSTKDPKRILLQRIRTTDRSNNEVTTTTDQISDVNHTTSSKMADSIILRVVSSSLAQISSVENPTSSAVAVIDMTMSTPYINRPIQQAGTTSNTNEHMKTSNRILDPATRLLDKGIATAIRNGDFNDLSAALIQGADPNYQMVSSSGGYTALMAAATKSNVRMVRRLLLKAVDVLAVNADGKTALDLVPTKLTARNSSDVTEIRSLIVRAVEAEGQRSRLKAFVESESCSSDNYVYDIYSVSSAVDAAAVSSEAPFSAVQVEGLKIVGEGNIDIDLLLSYDSDWSDLGEDEDPDSNDERFHGNDYPEEAASDEEDLLDPAYDDDDLDDAAAENSSDDEMPHSGRMGRSYSDRRGMSIGKGRLDGDNSDYDEDVDVQYDNAHEAQSRPTGCQLPRSTADRIAALDRSFGVGKVIRPAVIVDTGASSRPFGPLDTESLQLLWEESPPTQVDNDDDANGGSKDRIDQMRNRTGMVFASNPREFDAHGLPKYACDLSDDDGDALCEYGSHSINPHFNNSRPSLDAVAYDSELDRDSDDA